MMDAYQVRIYKNDVLDGTPINMVSGDECVITVGPGGPRIWGKHVVLKWRLDRSLKQIIKLNELLALERQKSEGSLSSFSSRELLAEVNSRL